LAHGRPPSLGSHSRADSRGCDVIIVTKFHFFGCQMLGGAVTAAAAGGIWKKILHALGAMRLQGCQQTCPCAILRNRAITSF
jgi:ribulose kinase